MIEIYPDSFSRFLDAKIETAKKEGFKINSMIESKDQDKPINFYRSVLYHINHELEIFKIVSEEYLHFRKSISR